MMKQQQTNLIVSIIQNIHQNPSLDDKVLQEFKELSFFGNIIRRYGKHSLQAVLKHVRIVNFKSQTIIIKEGDIADGIYLFLKGQAKIEATLNQRIFNPGDVVGEFGFYSKNQKRTATIIAIQDCQLGFFNKELVVQTIDNQMGSQFEEIFEFLQDNTLFCHWNNRQLKILVYQMNQLHFNKGQQVYNENQKCQYIYILKEGELELIQDYNQKKKKLMVITKHSYFGFDHYWGYLHYQQSVVVHSQDCVVLQVRFKTLFNALDSQSKKTLIDLISKHESKVQESIKNVRQQIELQQKYLKLPQIRNQGELLNRSKQQSDISITLRQNYHSQETHPETKKSKSLSSSRNHQTEPINRSVLLQSTFRNLQPQKKRQNNKKFQSELNQFIVDSINSWQSINNYESHKQQQFNTQLNDSSVHSKRKHSNRLANLILVKRLSQNYAD